MESSHGVLDDLEPYAAQSQSRVQGVLGAVGARELQDPKYQKLDQAKRDFVNAVLRRESGAAINKDEFDNANVQYFPQPGDSPQVIEQKRQNRTNAIASMKASAGERALNEVQQQLPTKKTVKGDIDSDGQISEAEKWVMNNPDHKMLPEVIKAIKARKSMNGGL